MQASNPPPDHFGPVAAAYAAFRPRYPEALFDRLAAEAPRRRIAWDCAAGSGQAAVALAERFPRVIATDASERQLEHAARHPRVSWLRSRAEQAPLATGSIDLVTVAQAIHWFDLRAFTAEARRVLAPGGVFAAWCYDLATIEPAIDAVVHRFYTETVGPWWPPERAQVERGYGGLALPFAGIALPAFSMEAAFTLPELLGYAGTWSSVTRYRAARKHDPVSALGLELAPLWGPPETRRLIRWPLSVRAGRR